MYTVKLSFMATERQKKIIGKRFLAVNKLHNVLVKHAMKLLNRVKKDHKYQDALHKLMELKKVKDPDKTQCAEMDALSNFLGQFREEIGLSKTGLETYCKVFRIRYTNLISSQQAQAEAGRVWKGVSDVLFDDGKGLHFRKISDMHTIGGKSNTNGVKFDPVNMEFEWLGERFRCKGKWNKKPDGRPNIQYIRSALCIEHPEDLEIRYCEISRESLKDGYHYYIILYIKGTAPDKGRIIGESTSGIDPGISTFNSVSDTSVFLEELAPDVMNYNKRIAKIQKQMDISKRATNPDNFNRDGTVKKKEGRIAAAKARAAKDGKPYNPKDYPQWIFTEHYIRLRWELRDLYRRKKAYTEQSHNILANRVLEDSKYFIVEKNNFAAMAKRSKKKAEREEKATTVTKKDGTRKEIHKFKKKKRLGKSVNDRSPAEILRIIERKALAAGGSWMEIDTRSFKASQYRHDTDDYEKVKLSKRMKVIDGHEVQRDLYSAFLILCAAPDGRHADREKCIRAFAHFCEMQDAKIKEMKEAGISYRCCFGF